MTTADVDRAAGRRARADLLLPWALAAALAAATWPVQRIMPSIGTDYSWHAALQMAAQHGLVFGRDIMFTYGPLGFLSTPEFWEPTPGAVAIVYTAFWQFAMCAALLLAARASWGIVGAAAFTYVAAIAAAQQAVLVAVAIAAIAIVTGRLKVRNVAVPAAVGGLIGAVQFLDKPPQGLATMAVVALTSLMLDESRWRALAAALCAFVVGFFGLWLALGQPVEAVGPFLTQARDVISGYGLSLGSEDPGRGWEYIAAPLVFVAGTALLWVGTARPRHFVIALWALVALFGWKEGFTRHDGYHAPQYFGPLLALVVTTSWTGRRRLLAFVMAAGLSAVALASLASPHASPVLRALDPYTRLDRAANAATAVLRPADRRADVERTRNFMVAKYAVPPRVVALVRGRTIHLAPVETAIVWAYRFRWRPLPLFQSYQAYTPRIDRLNRDTLRSDRRAPQLILTTRTGAQDGAWSPWDTPRTALESLCRYRTVYVDVNWQLAERGAYRCGPVRPMPGESSVRWGQLATVPATHRGEMLLMRVVGTGLSSLPEKLLDIVYKPLRRYVRMGGHTYRFIPDADDGTWLPIAAGAGADYRSPFNLAPNARTVAFSRQSGYPGGTIRLRFATMRVRGY